MGVITISREMGSLGFPIGQKAAELLGYQIVWREVINQAAIRAGAPEVALAMIDELGLLGLCPSAEKCQAYLHAVEQVVHELAERGNVVIVGRGSQIILKDRPGVLHVRVIAPLELRIERIMQEKGIALDAAQAQIEASDRSRKRYLNRFYKTQWEDPTLYDVILNTARISIDSAAELLYKAVIGLEQVRR